MWTAIAYGLIATLTGGVGFSLRAAAAYGRRLREQLAAQERAEAEAIRAEHERIADELHDVVAHDLIVMIMHARLLEHAEDEVRGASRAAIIDAGRRALADLRRVVERTGDGSGLSTERIGDLADAFTEARAELQASRRAVRISGDPANPQIPGIIGGSLARILAESTTNILKHAGYGEVSIALDVDECSSSLRITSTLPEEPHPAEHTAGGYGILRMAERARRLGGEFHAGIDGRTWVVSIRFSLYPATSLSE